MDCAAAQSACIWAGFRPFARRRVARETDPQASASVPGVLPEWPAGTVAILATAGPGPHAIPVSTALRAGPRTILMALAASRESLARLRGDPSVAVAIVAEDNLALTAYGVAVPLQDAMPDGVVAIKVAVERIQDHRRPAFVIEAGVRWRWTEARERERDAEVRTALEKIARTIPDG
jgi:hypothetical protein